MYKVTLSSCYHDEFWVFEDFETASLFAKMAIDCGKGTVEAKISKVQEGMPDESL